MGMITLTAPDLQGKFIEYGKHCLADGLILDQENEKQLIACIDVFEKAERGVMLIGNAGSGKTLFFEMMQKILHPQDPRMFVRVSVLDTVVAFNQKTIGHEVFHRYKDKNVFFDDLGTEDKGRHYGESVEVFEKFIQFRYDLYRNRGIKTHFTTNLNGQQVKHRYGDRCYSRLNEMCEKQIMGEKANSTDRRKLRNFKGLPQVAHVISRNQGGIDYDRYRENQKQNPIVQETHGEMLRRQLGTKTK